MGVHVVDLDFCFQYVAALIGCFMHLVFHHVSLILCFGNLRCADDHLLYSSFMSFWYLSAPARAWADRNRSFLRSISSFTERSSRMTELPVLAISVLPSLVYITTTIKQTGLWI